MLCWQSGFCGRFPPEHQVDLEYDHAPNAEHSKYEHMVAEKTKKKWSVFGTRKLGKRPAKDGNAGSQQAAFLWRGSARDDRVAVKTGKSGQETQARVKRVESRNKKLGVMYPHMMTCIRDLGAVYSIYLDNEGLTEVPPNTPSMDILTILELPRNRIRQFPAELGQCKRLERIILDWNHIDLMDQGIFSEKNFNSLEVLSIAHNKAKFCKLPDDFGTCRRPNKLKHIDLQDNSITDIPNSILECENLEFLDVSHNKIQRLPNQLGKYCTKLRKLFLSFNPLKELPETIGDCSRLQHIRVIDCELRVLPDSTLKLWNHPDYGGHLERLEVFKNPLILPSATAFKMGFPSLDRAFGLLADHVRFKEKQAQRARRQLANQEQIDGDTQKIVDAVTAGNELPVPEDSVQNIPGYEYYFKHCTGDDAKAQVNEIRNAESTLLIIKSNMYFENQKQQALRAQESMGVNQVPKSYRQFLDPTFDISKWHEKVWVTDLDLYFNLLVYSTKPLFSSCYTLFDRFEADGKGYLNREEWNELCLGVPVLLEDPDIKDRMWNLMSWRKEGRIFLNDFIAAWHIHDVETPDPWIRTMTKVLRLEYYDMTIEELRRRLKARDAEDATPELNFDEDPEQDDAEGDSDTGEKNESALDRLEGERWIVSGDAKDEKDGNNAGGIHDATQYANLISLSDAQYAIYQTTHGDGDEEKSDSDISMKSDQLSEEGESSDDDEEFSINWTQQSVRSVSQGQGAGGPFYVDSDDAMEKLMNMDPSAFFESQDRHDASAKKTAEAPRKPTKKNRGNKMPSHDNHFRTNVFPVRQEIRQVYRNLPHDDFVKLISFLLRGMQQIQHSRVGTITYWHADDPTFKFTMGELCTNAYTRKLLATMGFSFLAELLYWVWPDTHMSEVSKIAGRKVPIWGAEAIPKSCLGLNEDRLDDMIMLLKKCQKELHKKGKDFTGNFA